MKTALLSLATLALIAAYLWCVAGCISIPGELGKLAVTAMGVAGFGVMWLVNEALEVAVKINIAK